MQKHKLVNILPASLAVACLLSQSPGQSAEKGSTPTLTSLAGEYYKGDGLGENDFLVVTDGGRFSYLWYPDAGIPSRNRGTAEVVDQRLVLHPAMPDPHRIITGTEPPVLVTVKWGKRLYLLTEQEMLDFCNAVNLGIEPRDDGHGQFYLRMNSGKKARAEGEAPEIEAAEGWPELPRPWETHLLTRPVEGRITEIGSGQRGRVNLGSRDGIRRGMDLWVEGIGADGLASVRGVEVDCCWVEVRYDVPKKKGFEKGQRVLSRIPREVLVNESVFRGKS